MDSIVLLTKTPGITSFSSLFNVKRALQTKKVGHTGTLDSFAQGLLVVCTGRYTRLVDNIIQFNKTYKAVITFGKETDTLEYTGNIVKESTLPSLQDLQNSIKKFTGEFLQSPPIFSAIHIDGKRASDLVRQGESVEIPKRLVNVYKAELKDYVLDPSGNVSSCLIEFEVSKGTYIRSLARDIANDCNSCAYLSGLYRTKVGSFSIEDAAGFSLLKDFSIKNALQEEKEFIELSKDKTSFKESLKRLSTTDEEIIQKEIVEKKIPMTRQLSLDCGFYPINLKTEDNVQAFKFAKPLRKNFFVEYMDSLKDKSIFSVFYNDDFLGLITWNEEKLIYKFVNN